MAVDLVYALARWVALSDDEQNWALDAMEFEREQIEADEREIADRLADSGREPCRPDHDDHDYRC